MLAVVAEEGLKACLYTGLEREELEAVSDGIPALSDVSENRPLADGAGQLGQYDRTIRSLLICVRAEVLNRLFIKDKPTPKVFQWLQFSSMLYCTDLN